MAAHCAICSRSKGSPAYVACANCGQFACDVHHWVWQHGRAAFCQECWYDTSGRSLQDLADAIEAADRQDRDGAEAAGWRDEPSAGARRGPPPPGFRDLVQRLREDGWIRERLREDEIESLVIVLRRLADALEAVSRRPAEG